MFCFLKVTHPNHLFDISYVRYFRCLDEARCSNLIVDYFNLRRLLFAFVGKTCVLNYVNV